MPVAPLLVWDCETSGLNPVKDRILEIGWAVIDWNVPGGLITTKSYLLNHDMPIPPKLTEIHGITREMCAAEGVAPEIAMGQFLDAMHTAFAGLLLVGDADYRHLTHNGINFDIPFAVNELKRLDLIEDAHGLREKMEATALDTAVLFKARQIQLAPRPDETFKRYADRVLAVRAFGVKFNVAHCCDTLQIDRGDVTQHRTIADVTLTYRIALKLLGGARLPAGVAE